MPHITANIYAPNQVLTVYDIPYILKDKKDLLNDFLLFASHQATKQHIKYLDITIEQRQTHTKISFSERSSLENPVSHSIPNIPGIPQKLINKIIKTSLFEYDTHPYIFTLKAAILSGHDVLRIKGLYQQ